MNSTISRTFKALCLIAVSVVLTSCGSSSTVDPFKPTRVIGLGDGYNDATATVREVGSTTGTVVGQVAAYFGQTNVVSQASSGALVSNLGAQIDAIGGFSNTDLVVISIGTFDVKATTDPTVAAQTLATQIQRLLDAGVTHVLIMPVLDLSRTPWGRATRFDPSATPTTSLTNTFNAAVNTKISAQFGGTTPNRVIYAGSSNVTSEFLRATDGLINYPTFGYSGYNGSTACGNLLFTGCDAGAAGVSTDYASLLFADGIHLTPAGNRWAALYLFNATRQGWR